jgi:hypothetical protein
MKLAAITTKLDDIKISPSNIYREDEIKKIRTLFWFGYEKRILNKASRYVTKDIDDALKFDSFSEFIPFAFCSQPYRKGIWIYLDLGYYFRYNRFGKIKKLLKRISDENIQT